MSATRTVKAKGRLIYALPLAPPIPFLKQPAYPIALPTRDLPQAYADALWPQESAQIHEQSLLDSFARLLIALLTERTPADLNTLIRTLLIPLQDFDKRWRDLMPGAVEPQEDEPVASTSGIATEEHSKLWKDYGRWEVKERVRLEEERTSRKNKMTKGKGKERTADQEGQSQQLEGSGDEEEEGEIRVRAGDWLSEKELLETRLQALLLLTLLSLPITFQPDLPKKGRKKKNPEKYSETLDPSMLLDFLTDRMQIWRVMKDVSEIDVAGLGDTQEGEANEKVQKEEERDTIQRWWQDVVEPLFRTHVDASVLSHHRLKLFPAPSQAERVAQRLVPAPSPFKTRSLLSLERSARRRDLEDGQKLVTESPTMKRLMSNPSLLSEKNKTSARSGSNESKDVFKVPGMPVKRKESLEKPEDAKERGARKQERPRPLPRGGSTTGTKDVLKRREVSLTKKTSSAGLLKKPANQESAAEGDGKKRKRKGNEPKSLAAATPTLTLVPDTPSKPTASSSSSSLPNDRAPMSRATSLPSFAALGAAFRGSTEVVDRRRKPDLGGMWADVSQRPHNPCTQMDWEPEDGCSEDDEVSAEDVWLDGREDDWRKKGGRQRQSSYNEEGEEEESGKREKEQVATPKKARQTLLVPDT